MKLERWLKERRTRLVVSWKSIVLISLHLFALNGVFVFRFPTMREAIERREAASETYFPATAENLPERIANGRICDPTDAVETVPCETRRHQELQRIIRVAEFYDYWLVYRPPPDFRGMIESVSGVVLVAQEGDVSLWRNKNAHPFEPSL